MIELIFSFYQRIEKDDSKCNCEKLQKNDLLLKEVIGTYGVCNTDNCKR